MNHSRMHTGHMWLIAGVAVAAVLLGYSIGWAIAIALIGCGAMFVAVVWLLYSDRDRQDRPGERHDTRDDAHRSGGA